MRFACLVLACLCLTACGGSTDDERFENLHVSNIETPMRLIGKALDQSAGNDSWRKNQTGVEPWEIKTLRGTRLELGYLSGGCSSGNMILTVVEAKSEVFVQLGDAKLVMSPGTGCLTYRQDDNAYIEHPGPKRLVQAIGIGTEIIGCAEDESCFGGLPSDTDIIEMQSDIVTERVWIDAQPLPALIADRSEEEVILWPRDLGLAASYCQIGYRVSERKRERTISLELFGLKRPLGTSECASDGFITRKIFVPPADERDDPNPQIEVL